MKRLLLVPAVALAIVWACGSNPLPAATGQFVAPASFAATSGGDRDLLFIANSGSDELRALQICSTPLLADGGVDPTNTCPSSEDFQFLPGPARLYPATINVVARPTRLAGLRLCVADGGGCSATNGGVALVAGADPRLGVVDARHLVDEASHRVTPDGGPLQTLALEAPALDVVTSPTVDPATQAELPQPSARGYVAIRAHGTVPAKLVAVDVSLDDRGYARPPVAAGSCELPGVTPRKIAIAKGGGTKIYVADGVGDGAIEVLVSALVPAGGDCSGRRISFGGPLRSVAVSPAFLTCVPAAAPATGCASTTAHAPGEILAAVTESGRLLFARTGDGNLFPVPPASYDSTAAVETMEPLNPQQAAGGARDVVFLDAPRCDNPPCTQVYAGTAKAAVTANLNLVALATANDGAAYYIDVTGRRFVNSTYFDSDRSLRIPRFDILPLATDLVFTPAQKGVTGRNSDGWVNPGVTRTARWTAIYHAAIPGLERRGGNVTVNADGSLTFETQGGPLSSWSAPPIQLRTGDRVSFGAYFPPGGACPELANESPLRVEIPISAIVPPNTLVLDPAHQDAGGGTPLKLNPATCPSFGAVAEIRAAADEPWLIRSGNEVRKRLAVNVDWAATNTRFDYSTDYIKDNQTDTLLDGTRAADLEVSFKIVRADPVPGTQIVFSLLSEQVFMAVRDPVVFAGLSTGAFIYTSRRYTNLSYVAVTGSNEVLQGDPLNLATVGGIVAYR